MTLVTTMVSYSLCLWLPGAFAVQVTSPSSPRVSATTLVYEQPAGNIVTLSRNTVDMPGTDSITGNDARTVTGFFKTGQTDSYNIFECGTPSSSCGMSFAMGRWFGEHGTSSQGMTCHTWCGCYSNSVGKSSQSVSIDSGTWYHFAHVYDGTTHYLYFDGALFSSGTDNNNPLTTAATGCVFGSKDGRFSFDGQVKSAKVYSGAMSASEIASSASGSSPGVGGTSAGTSAVGDPHLQNVNGERFDLMKVGKHVLINIPRGMSAEHALLRVQADARRLGSNCADMYFQELNVTGSWAEAKQAGGYHYSASQSDGKAPEWLAFGLQSRKVELKVVHGRTLGGLMYLNVYVKHLGRAGFAVGGLLGEDEHNDVMIPPESCTRHMSMAAVEGSGQAGSSVQSVAMATFE